MKKKVVIGVIGSDCHAVGNKIIEQVLKINGFEVINIGTHSSKDDFVNSATENDADAIIVSSIYGQELSNYRGIRKKCNQNGLRNILIYIGGNIATKDANWDDVEKTFLNMGFDRAYKPGTPIETTVEDLRKDLTAKI